MITPQNVEPRLAEALGLSAQLYLKREDLHPYGSHKGRSIPLMIEKYVKAGRRDFVISSSGNAALAAAYCVQNYNCHSGPGAGIQSPPLKLKIFVGEKIDGGKMKMLADLADKNIEFRQVKNPRQSAFAADKAGHGQLLRQSSDGSALNGYDGLARELAKIKNLSAVFIPTSSGTTAQALHHSFRDLGVNPQIHIVQTSVCHPIAAAVENNKRLPLPETEHKDETSLAGAIVDKIARRKEKVLRAIKNSHGNGWIANNAEIAQAMKQVKKYCDFDVSANSALSVAGLAQALASGWEFDGPVACLITGR